MSTSAPSPPLKSTSQSLVRQGFQGDATRPNHPQALGGWQGTFGCGGNASPSPPTWLPQGGRAMTRWGEGDFFCGLSSTICFVSSSHESPLTKTRRLRLRRCCGRLHMRLWPGWAGPSSRALLLPWLRWIGSPTKAVFCRPIPLRALELVQVPPGISRRSR